MNRGDLLSDILFLIMVFVIVGAVFTAVLLHFTN